MKKLIALLMCLLVLQVGTAQVIHAPPVVPKPEMASLGVAVLAGVLAGAAVVLIQMLPWDHQQSMHLFPDTVIDGPPYWPANSNLVQSANSGQSLPLTVSNVCGHIHFKPGAGPINPVTTNWMSDYFTCVVQVSHTLTNWHSYPFDMWVDPTGGYVLNWAGNVTQGTLSTGMILPMPDDLGTNYAATYFRILNP